MFLGWSRHKVRHKRGARSIAVPCYLFVLLPGLAALARRFASWRARDSAILLFSNPNSGKARSLLPFLFLPGCLTLLKALLLRPIRNLFPSFFVLLPPPDHLAYFAAG